MQTFLPYPSFIDSVRCLDYRRVGKQRLEAYQLLQTLQGVRKGWRNHPATLMWQGYEEALTAYYNTAVGEWIARGYRNTMPILQVTPGYTLPLWFGSAEFHSRHRAALLAKDPTWYGRFGWTEVPRVDYLWPTG